MEKLLHEILLIQKQANKEIWANGMFPSIRVNPYWAYKRPDNNVFFTACIVFTLNQLKHKLPKSSQDIIEVISKLANKNFIDYQEKEGEFIYNFYPTKPSRHFGNGIFFNKFKHFQLPHDADDTALIYLCSHFSLEKNFWLQNKLANHANGSIKWNKNTFEKYKSLKAYSTWFGKKMAIELDTCVLCNVLLCQLQAGLQLDENGLASWEFIKGIVFNNYFLSHSFKASRNYAKPSIIAYHLARFIENSEIQDMETVKEQLILGLHFLENIIDLPFYEKVLVSTSLLRLGEKTKFELPNDNFISKQRPLNYFIAGMLSAYEYRILIKLAELPFFHIRWQCDAFQKTLLLENMVLRIK